MTWLDLVWLDMTWFGLAWQVLPSWEWVKQDLIELGIKYMDPSIFAADHYKHVPTSQMQVRDEMRSDGMGWDGMG